MPANKISIFAENSEIAIFMMEIQKNECPFRNPKTMLLGINMKLSLELFLS